MLTQTFGRPPVCFVKVPPAGLVALAVLTALADAGTEGRAGAALRAATADGEFRVVLLTALGMAAGLLIALRLPRGQARPGPVTGSPDAPRVSSAGRGEPGVPDRAGSGNP
ncbi:hypothetical protein [Streptomyces echinatus]|uniref:hypothetical protein n=1 Tax=Streptomyces echinatus TaxID=67293 RepID=UPI0038235E86